MYRFFVGLAVFFLCTGFGDPVYTTNKKGNALFEQGKFDEALKTYSGGLSSESLDPRSDRLDYNLGNAAIKTGDYENAIKSLTLASRSKDLKLRRGALFNRGYAQIKGGDKAKEKGDLESAGKLYKGAVADYRHLTRMEPVDENTIYNLELAMKKLKQLKQDQKKKKEEKKKNDKKNKKDQEKEGKEEKSNQGAPEKKKSDNKEKNSGNNQQKNEGSKPAESSDEKDTEKEKEKPKGISKEQAEQVFNVIDEQEKKLRGKMKHGTGKPKEKKSDKDW